jgi:hypothetical protein
MGGLELARPGGRAAGFRSQPRGQLLGARRAGTLTVGADVVAQPVRPARVFLGELRAPGDRRNRRSARTLGARPVLVEVDHRRDAGCPPKRIPTRPGCRRLMPGANGAERSPPGHHGRAASRKWPRPPCSRVLARALATRPTAADRRGHPRARARCDGELRRCPRDDRPSRARHYRSAPPHGTLSSARLQDLLRVWHRSCGGASARRRTLGAVLGRPAPALLSRVDDRRPAALERAFAAGYPGSRPPWRARSWSDVSRP